MTANAKILIVDDDPDILETLNLMLKAEGHTPIQANTMKAGLAAFKAERPALVFADLMMETVDAGIELVQKIKAIDDTVAVYLLTSVGNTLGDNTGPADLNADGIIQKPIQVTTLKRILADRLG